VNDTRERILAVAQELFIEQGYDGTSLREIADRLGFTKAALYYHFRSKDEILLALIEPGTGLVGEFLERLTMADGVEAWADALAWIINQMFDHLEFFKLIERNRNSVLALHEHLESLTKHLDMHTRVEEAVRRATSDLREQVRMVAAVGAVTGFDDWAPRLLAEAPSDRLRAELIAATRDVLELPALDRQPTG
jgi:AcrR family transcriptional regulator